MLELYEQELNTPVMKRRNANSTLDPLFKNSNCHCFVCLCVCLFLADAKVQGQEVVPVLTARHTEETTAGTLMPGLSLYKREKF